MRTLAFGLALLALSAPARAGLLISRLERRPVAQDDPVLVRADVELNARLRIIGVELVVDSETGRQELRLPQPERADKLPSIRILNKDLEAGIARALADKDFKPEAGPMDLVFTAGEPRPTGDAKRPVEIELTFRSELAVLFGVVPEGKRWGVAYPSRKGAKGPEPLFQVLLPVIQDNIHDAVMMRSRPLLKKDKQ